MEVYPVPMSIAICYVMKKIIIMIFNQYPIMTPLGQTFYNRLLII